MLKTVKTGDQLQRVVQRIDWSTLRFDENDVITVQVRNGSTVYIIPPHVWKTPDSPFCKETAVGIDRTSGEPG